jgi:hypothetical protein
MDRAGCAHCRPPAERARLERLDRQLRAGTSSPPGRAIDEDPNFELSHPVPAKHRATCPVCRYIIEPGDLIRCARPGWIHTECA